MSVSRSGPPQQQSGGLFVSKWSQRLEAGAAGRASLSLLDPRRSKPRAGRCAGSWRMLWSFSIPASHGDGFCAYTGAVGLGDSRTGCPQGVASPQLHAQAAGGTGGFEFGELGVVVARVFSPVPSPLKGEVWRRMGNFPLCVGALWALKRREGSVPGGCGAGAEHSTPVPLPLEPSGAADKELHYLCSFGSAHQQPLGSGAGTGREVGSGTGGLQGQREDKAELHTAVTLAVTLTVTSLSSPWQRQHPSPSAALEPRGMWSHRGSGEWGSSVSQFLCPAPGVTWSHSATLGTVTSPGKLVLLPAR